MTDNNQLYVNINENNSDATISPSSSSGYSDPIDHVDNIDHVDHVDPNPDKHLNKYSNEHLGKYLDKLLNEHSIGSNDEHSNDNHSVNSNDEHSNNDFYMCNCTCKEEMNNRIMNIEMRINKLRLETFLINGGISFTLGYITGMILASRWYR